MNFGPEAILIYIKKSFSHKLANKIRGRRELNKKKNIRKIWFWQRIWVGVRKDKGMGNKYNFWRWTSRPT